MMKTMKKYSILLGVALSLFALASCQKEVDINVSDTDVVKHVPFELNADIPQTRTTIDSETWEMDWENGDILYAVTDDEEWGVAYSSDNDGETIADFTYANGKFSTQKTISDGEHTFHFLYTANVSQRSYHRGKATSFSLASSQNEDASNPTIALKMNDVLAGKVKATTPTTFANVSMEHIFTLMKVTLKNKTGEAISVNKFEIKAEGAEIAGIFNVKFDKDVPYVDLKQSGKDNIAVEITNGSIAVNGDLPVFFVMAPLSNYSGDITFTVSDTDGNTYTKKNTVADVSFNPGEYNTATYSLKNADPIECVELDWTYPTGDDAATSAGINAIPGVTTNGLGSDYAAGNSPYCIKFDNTGDFIQVRTDKAIGSVSVKYKMLGGSNTSKLEISESADGSTWTKVEDLTISGAQNSTGELTTAEDFDSDSRFVKINFNKGSNVGIGGITIKQQNTDPIIFADNISGVAAVGATGTLTYTVKNFTDDVTVSEVTGCVSQATASQGSVSYTISPNYNSSAASGTIVLVSASNNEITKTINVGQLKSSLTVTPLEVIIPANEETASFTITSPEFGWNISADDESHLVFDKSGNASTDATTVTVMSDLEATDAIQTIATLTIVRNENADDPQSKQVVVKKAKIVDVGVVTYSVVFSRNNFSAGVQNYTSSFSVTDGGLTLDLMNFNNNNKGWDLAKAGAKKSKAADPDMVTTGTITTSTAIPEAIKNVIVSLTLDRGSATAKMFVATDEDFTSNVQTVDYGALSSGDIVFAVPTPSENAFYKLEFVCTNTTTTNGVISVSKVVYTTDDN